MVRFRFSGASGGATATKWVVGLGLVAVVTAASVATAGAQFSLWSGQRPYWAWVYMDRGLPESAVPVYDLRVNESPMSPTGHQGFVLYSPDGTFDLPFSMVKEVLIHRSLGRIEDTARYDTTVILKDGRETRRGRIELVSLHGQVEEAPWHVLLTARDDRGANLYRIVFVDPDELRDDAEERERAQEGEDAAAADNSADELPALEDAG